MFPFLTLDAQVPVLPQAPLPTLVKTASVQPPAQTPRPEGRIDGLEQDARLQHKISLDERGTSLASLLLQVAEPAGVSLTAARDLADQKLQARLRGRTLASLMGCLADLLQAEWKPDGANGYRLSRSPEAAHYQRRWWALYEPEREKAIRAVSGGFAEAMNRPPPSLEVIQSLKDPSDRVDVENSIQDARFWYGLPAPVKKAVAASVSDIFTYRRPAPFSIESPEGGVAVLINNLSEACKAALFHVAQTYNTNFTLSGMFGITIMSGGSSYQVSAFYNDGRQVPTGLTLVQYDIDRRLALSVDHRHLPGLASRSSVKVTPVWQRLIEYQKKTVWDNGVPPDTVAEMLPPLLPEALERLGDASGMEYVADYYSLPARPLTEKERRRKPEPPLDKELDRLAATHDVSWKRSGDVVLVRNNRWYRDDLLEAPLGQIRHLDAAMGAKAPPSLDPENAEFYRHMGTVAEVASRLTLWQIANGLYYYVDEQRLPPPEQRSDAKALWEANCQPYTHIAEMCLGNYRTSQFYATLSESARLRLITRGLPLSELTFTQIEQLGRVKPDLALAPLDTLIRLTYERRSLKIGVPTLFGNAHGPMPPYRLRFVGVRSDDAPEVLRP